MGAKKARQTSAGFPSSCDLSNVLFTIGAILYSAAHTYNPSTYFLWGYRLLLWRSLYQRFAQKLPCPFFLRIGEKLLDGSLLHDHAMLH